MNIPQGLGIRPATVDLCLAAQQQGKTLQAEFNGFVLVAHPTSTPDELRQKYWDSQRAG